MSARGTGATPGGPAPFSGAGRAARSAALARGCRPHLACGQPQHTLLRDSGKAGLAGDSFALRSGRVFPPPPISAPPPRPRHPHKKCKRDWMARDREQTANEAAPCARHHRAGTRGRTEIPGMPRDVSLWNPPQGSRNAQSLNSLPRTVPWNLTETLKIRLDPGVEKKYCSYGQNKDRRSLNRSMRCLAGMNCRRADYTSCATIWLTHLLYGKYIDAKRQSRLAVDGV